MLTGSRVGPFEVGQKIGQGGFGEIYMAKSEKDKKLYAMKTEPKNSPRKTLEFEAKILKSISKFDIFPMYAGFGRNSTCSWLSMELLGPSLSSVIRRLPKKHLSLKCGFIVGLRVLKSIQLLHDCGFIHRDVKPGNVLIRRSCINPVSLIDFGLSRIYIDEKTGQHLPARPHPGFRGTAVYASPNAHMHQDLSRRDDMVSWFYFLLDILSGKLPWKHLQNRADILHSKRRLNIEEVCAPIAPELVTIWNAMANMAYADRPDYEKITRLMSDIIERNEGAKDYDWHPALYNMDESIGEIFGGYETIDMMERSIEDTGGASNEDQQKPTMNTPLLPIERDEEGSESCDCCI